jgi:hypothetical protein
MRIATKKSVKEGEMTSDGEFDQSATSLNNKRSVTRIKEEVASRIANESAESGIIVGKQEFASLGYMQKCMQTRNGNVRETHFRVGSTTKTEFASLAQFPVTKLENKLGSLVFGLKYQVLTTSLLLAKYRDERNPLSSSACGPFWDSLATQFASDFRHHHTCCTCHT